MNEKKFSLGKCTSAGNNIKSSDHWEWDSINVERHKVIVENKLDMSLWYNMAPKTG